jgi:hypothetical protein
MDKTLWQKIASFWTVFRSAEEKEKTAQAIEAMFHSAISNRQKEKSIVDELRGSLDEEDDDDGY